MYVRGKANLRSNTPCSVLGCILDAMNERSMCTQHYAYSLRYGNPFATGARIPKPDNDKCTFPYCRLKYQSRGFCRNHYKSIIDKPRRLHYLKIQEELKQRSSESLTPYITLFAAGNKMTVANIGRFVGSELKATKCEVATEVPLIKLYFRSSPSSDKISKALKIARERGIKVDLFEDSIADPYKNCARLA